MAENLLITRTKIITPQRRKDYLSRTRLLDLLSDLLDFRLIILAAPAGYGKTSLLVDFAHQFEWPVCWFALEPIDKDLGRFLSHFVYAIRQQFPEFGGEPIRILETTAADQINLDFLITTITNDIYDNITEHFILVLDDYHLLQSSPKIDQFLSDFVQRTDDNCHVAITSRKLLTLPDLPLMVARSQVGGLSVEELAFQQEEILDLFNNIFGRSITPEEAGVLSKTTEGWITGLLLTSKTLRGGMGETSKVARTSGVGLYEYLAQQVLEQQPMPIQDFLLNSSILEEFDAGICEQVIGRALNQKSEWNSMIDHIIQNNLFYIPVGDDSLWLRYHHLFRDFLQATIDRSRPDDARRIRTALADYYKERKDWERVFEIYNQLGDEEKLAQLISEVGSDFIAKGKVPRLSQLLDLLPDKTFKENPVLLSLKASVAVNQGRIQNGSELLDSVIDMLDARSNPALFADNLIRRSAAKRVLGDYDNALRDADQAIHITKNKDSLNHLYSEALRAKGILFYQQGKLRNGLEYFEQAISICESHRREEDMARFLVETGAIYETLGLFSEAESAYSRSLAYWQSIGNSIFQPTILNNLGVLQHSMGDLLNSFYNLEKSMRYSQETGNQRMEGYSLASIGDLYRDLSALEEAEDAYQKALEIAAITEDQYLIFYLKIVQARISIMTGQTKKAELRIRAAQSIAKKSGSMYEINKYRLEEAVHLFWNAEYTKALDNLRLSEDFFSKEGHLEDTIRTQFYIFLALQKTGETNRSLHILEEIQDRISEPKYYIPIMSSAVELNDFIRQLSLKKAYAVRLSILLDALTEFQENAQKSRMTIRKHASVVPFAPANISVRTFGAIEVTAMGQKLTISDWKSQVSRDLFLIFLANPRGITKGDIGLIFWPDSSDSELKLRFKNAIYRMRHAVGSEVVLFQDNIYLVNPSVDMEYDIREFTSSIKKAAKENDPSSKIQALRKAVSIYQGHYLPDLDMEWVVTDREKYLGMFTEASMQLSQLLLESEEYQDSLDVAQKALDFNPFFEPLYRICMQNYAARGDKVSVARQYEKCRELLTNEIGAEPSSQTIDLYEELMGT